MGKILVFLVVIGGLYYIWNNPQYLNLNETKNQIQSSIQNAAPIKEVQEGRIRRKKEILDASRF